MGAYEQFFLDDAVADIFLVYDRALYDYVMHIRGH